MQFALYVFMAISLMLLRLFKSIITCYQATNRFVWFSICKMASPPPANVGWSINNGGISGVGRCRLEYELPKILGVGWGINYIRHPYPSCVSQSTFPLSCADYIGLPYSLHLVSSPYHPNHRFPLVLSSGYPLIILSVIGLLSCMIQLTHKVVDCRPRTMSPSLCYSYLLGVASSI